MKVLFINNIPSKYRVNFFNKIGKLCDLTVVFEQTNLRFRDKTFIDSDYKNFKTVFLNANAVGAENSISFKVKRYLKRDYDLIILGNYHTFTDIIAMDYMIRKNIKYVLSVDGMFINKDENKLKLKLKKRFFGGAAFFLTTGDASVEAIKYYGGDHAKCFIYPFSSVEEKNVLSNVVDRNEKRNLRKKHNIPIDSKIYLYVGQMIERKGIDKLLESFPADNKYTLILIGGLIGDEYNKIIKKRDLKNIINYDFIQSEKLDEYYRLADFFVLPTNEDAWALVINEALAQSLPVISTNKALGAFELIKGKGTGFIVENTVNGLKRAINYSSAVSDADYVKMQKNALTIAKKFTIEEMVNEHVKIFQEIIDRDGSRKCF